MTAKKKSEILKKGKLKGKSILITGGTGSFGNVVTEKLLEYNPKKVVIFSRDEKKQFDMRNKFNDNPKLKFVIGDVRDKKSLDRIIPGINFVFHAAALKQVPTCEFFPLEAIRTNSLGAENVIRSSIDNNVESVVVLSTDKAVYPINVVGMTKALMEKIMISEAKNLNSSKTKTQLSGVRYGNVLYTRGSVIPYFVNLIKQNKRLPVTQYEMTRFLLPLGDAVSLVLFALNSRKNGSIYVKKSPSCTMETLAKALCNLFEHKKGYYQVGIRAGEKMHETLITEEEFIRAIDLGDYFEIPPESQGLDYSRYFFRGEKFKNKIEPYTSSNTRILKLSEVEKLLLSIPEIRRELKLHKGDRVV